MRFARGIAFQDSTAKFLEQLLRKHPVIVPARFPGNGTKIVSRPGETVQFVEPDPLTPAIETESTAGFGRYLDGGGRIVGRNMRDGRYDGPDLAVAARNGNDDGAR